MDKSKLQWTSALDPQLARADDAADFLQGNFGQEGADAVWSGDYLRWKLGSSNPAGGGYLAVASIGERIVGTVTLTRKRVIVNGSVFACGEVGDTYSAADVRRNSEAAELLADFPADHYFNKSIFGRLATLVRQRASQDGLRLIYGTPNQNAYPGWTTRLGYFDVAQYQNHSYSRPMAGLLIARYPALTRARKALKYIDKFGLAVSRILNRQMHGFEWSSANGPPSQEDLDQLWQENIPVTGFSLVKDAEFWLHRFVRHPLAQYRYHRLVRNGELHGLVVSRLSLLENGKKCLSIVDWLMSDSIHFAHALMAVLDDGGNQADIINVWLDSESKEAIAARNYLFIKRNRVPVMFADNAGVEREIKGTLDRFSFNLGSGDGA